MHTSAIALNFSIHKMSNLLSEKRRLEDRQITPPLYTECYGEGDETLVFLAGLGGTTRYWKSRIAPLTRSHKIILVDLLGFGESPKPWIRYSADHHIEALRGTLATLGPFTIIGHSLGALLAVAYAARFPEQIKNMVLMSLPYFGSEEDAYRYFRKNRNDRLRGLVVTNMGLTIIACLITRRVLGKFLPYLIRDMPKEVVADLVKHTWISSTSSLWEVVYRYDALSDILRIPERIDVLCIHGDRDTTAPLFSLDLIQKHRPGWRIEMLHDVDHHPFLRDTARCIELIKNIVP
ncbi:MAG: hypothetical protein CMI63_19795 [Parvularcula sp.]|nr:hypothetical protein [Parvularcula sp.]